MNPRAGQYGLGGSLHGWTRLNEPTEQQRRNLCRCYAGRNLRGYSRFGIRQWAAPLPWTRVVVKDPFALLSIPAVVAATGALPVLVYRHPGAVAVSYRRMGWRPDTAEIASLRLDPSPATPTEPGDDDLDTMAHFWNACNATALRDMQRLPGAVVVSHEELTLGGHSAAQRLFAACGLDWSVAAARFVDGPAADSAGSAPEPGRLHNFERTPDAVAHGWRSKLSPDAIARLERTTLEVREALNRHRTHLHPGEES
jgi:hypothetical protein